MRVGRRTCSQGAHYNRKESIKSQVHRTRCLPLKVTRCGHIHSGGEVAHKLTLRIKETKIITAHKKGGSEGISYMFEELLLKRYLRSSTGSKE
jgi:hypothetical protein